MTPRPTPDSAYPFTRGDVVSITGVGVPTILNLQRGRVLRKRRGGPGNYTGYSPDDALRIMLSKELLRVGLQVSSIHSLFESLERPPTHKDTHRWEWLRSAESLSEGAALVLLAGHPRRPKGTPETTGFVYLTTAAEARRQIAARTSEATVIVIDMNVLIMQLEERTGQPYRTSPPEGELPTRSNA